MRARLLAAFLLLDGLCALALPALGALAVSPTPQAEGAYRMVAGSCVETMPMEGDAVGGRVVAMTFCEG